MDIANRLRVTAHALNVREQPSAEAAPLGFLHAGEVVTERARSKDRRWVFVQTAGSLIGWASAKYLQPAVVDVGRQAQIEPRWMSIARGEIGQRERAGRAANPRILDYLASTTLPRSYKQSDETHWCSAFVNWCVEQAGYAGTDSAAARSWLAWGRPIATPIPGCIVVFTRTGGGHVAFYVEDAGSAVRVLGGNQSNAVSIAPYAKSRIIGYRMPADLAA